MKMNYSFKGYTRYDGSSGTRNYVGIVSSVICSSSVVHSISDKIKGSIPFVHANGCAQLGDDFKLTRNILAGVSSNPNLHSALLVGLGCETNQVSGLLKSIPKTKPIKGIEIQQLAGGKNTIEKGATIAEKWVVEAKQQKREELPLSSLTMGILNVDLDEKSLKIIGPVISNIVNLLVKEDAKVIMGFSKTLEPAGELLSKRVRKVKDKEKLIRSSGKLRRIRWGMESQEFSRNNEFTFTEEEKKLAILESKLTGKMTINSILNYGEIPDEDGLHMMHVSSNIVESLSKMASSGCNIVLLVSSRGVLASSNAVPCMTITTQNDKESFDELVDHTIMDGKVEEQANRLLEEVLEICSGRETQLEKFDLGEFSIPHLGTTY